MKKIDCGFCGKKVTIVSEWGYNTFRAADGSLFDVCAPCIDGHR